MWTGERERGAQLDHLFERAVSVWTHRYGQDRFVEIDIDVSDDMENLGAVGGCRAAAERSEPGVAREALALRGRGAQQILLTDVQLRGNWR